MAPRHYFNYSNSDRPSPTYNVIYEGAKNKIVVQKKMMVYFLFGRGPW